MMIEAAILNNTQRLLAQGPYIVNPPKINVIHTEPYANVDNPYKHLNGIAYEYLYNDVLDLFFFKGGDSAGALWRLNLNKWRAPNQVSPMTVQDTTLAVQQLCMEPGGTGRMFGFVRVNGANDGLWKRETNGAWSKVVGVAANSAQRMFIKPNGDLWYFNINGSAWYQIQAGTVGASQATVPNGLNYGAAQSWPTAGFYNVEPFQSGYLGGLWTTQAIGANITPFVNMYYTGGSGKMDSTLNPSSSQYNSYNISYRAIHSSAVPTGSGTVTGYGGDGTTYLNSVPEELYWNTQMICGSTNKISKWIRLNATYSLMTLTVSQLAGYVGSGINGSTWYSRQTGFEPSRQKIGLALYNKVTNTFKYLGVVSLPSLIDSPSVSASESGTYDMQIIGARLLNNNLDLVMSGCQGMRYDGNPNNMGSIWMQIHLNKLDF